MKIYTRRGDDGTTSLVGGTRITKGSLRIEAYGTLDELTANIGFLASNFELKPDVRAQLEEILSRVMDCAAIVASEDTTIVKLPQISQKQIEHLEAWCDYLLDGLPQLQNFTLPIGAPAMAYAHVCRTVARRAERAIVRAVGAGDAIPAEVRGYINRLSDYLYALTRRLSAESHTPDVLWRAGQ